MEVLGLERADTSLSEELEEEVGGSSIVLTSRLTLRVGDSLVDDLTDLRVLLPRRRKTGFDSLLGIEFGPGLVSDADAMM